MQGHAEGRTHAQGGVSRGSAAPWANPARLSDHSLQARNLICIRILIWKINSQTNI